MTSSFLSTFPFDWSPSFTFTPKQTLTPYTFAVTPSMSPTSNVAFFTSVGMLVFYVIFALLIVSLITVFIIIRIKNMKLEKIERSASVINIIEQMKEPLADNPDLPDDGVVTI